MAVIKITKDEVYQNPITVAWNAVTGSDTGEPWIAPRNADKTVQVVGTFGDTLTIQGSNNGSNWETLSDFLGLPLTFTAAGMKLMAEAPKYIRPSAGASITSVNVIITSSGE